MIRIEACGAQSAQSPPTDGGSGYGWQGASTAVPSVLPSGGPYSWVGECRTYHYDFESTDTVRFLRTRLTYRRAEAHRKSSVQWVRHEYQNSETYDTLRKPRRSTQSTRTPPGPALFGTPAAGRGTPGASLMHGITVRQTRSIGRQRV